MNFIILTLAIFSLQNTFRAASSAKHCLEDNNGNVICEDRMKPDVVSNLVHEIKLNEKPRQGGNGLIINYDVFPQNNEKPRQGGKGLIKNYDGLAQNNEKPRQGGNGLIINYDVFPQNNEKPRQGGKGLIKNYDGLAQNNEKPRQGGNGLIINYDDLPHNNEKLRQGGNGLIINYDGLPQNNEKPRQGGNGLIINYDGFPKNNEKGTRRQRTNGNVLVVMPVNEFKNMVDKQVLSQMKNGKKKLKFPYWLILDIGTRVYDLLT
ncbi:uncharacterized protein LOC112045967 [Bicyclus anynana]|uniref:Uncharacterized protein LOC112045967 n=1 Tax=Bicyclus anynana TaxID=110368 RepID=A0A6J1MR89_BICAN|nr:uncharacterized protein LOC112045967 [Bicyclus anynana]